MFRSEATGAAQVVAGRFGRGPINVQYNSKKGGGATIQGLANALQTTANGMGAENDVLSNTTRVFAALFVLGAFGMAFFATVGLIERLSMPWVYRPTKPARSVRSTAS